MPPEPTRPRPAILIAALVIVILAAYAPAAGGVFIWDDHHLLAALSSSERPGARSSILELLGSTFWLRDDFDPEGGTYYRPLTILSLGIDRAIHGNNPSGFHLTNLALHAANAGLLFALVRRLGAGALTAFGAAAFWGLYPRLTEAAAWISGRTDVLAATFVLSALLVAQNDAPRSRANAAILIFFGLLAKEVALAGLVGLGVLELARARGEPWRRRLIRFAPLAIAALAYLALRLWAVGTGLPSGVTAEYRVLAALESVGRYAFMLLDPWQPNIRIGRMFRPALPFVIAGGLILPALGFLAFRLRRRIDAPRAALLAVLATSFFLVMHLLPLAVRIVAADRFLYVPLAMLAALAAPALGRLAARARLVAPLAAALIVSFGFVTFTRTEQWSDEIDFWLTAYRQQEVDNSLSRVELGNVYFRAGLSRQALSLYLDADDLDYRSHQMAVNNTGITLFSTGRYERALKVFARLTAQEPAVPRFWLNRALVNTARFRFDAAERHVQRALSIYPDFREAERLARSLPELRVSAKTLGVPPATHDETIDRARRSARLQRFPEAFATWRAAFERGEGRPEEAQEALLVALNLGEFESVRALYAAYRRLAANAPSPELIQNYEIRAAHVARLLEVWPSLGLSLAELGPLDPFPEPQP